jgi:hypothetical protein
MREPPNYTEHGNKISLGPDRVFTHRVEHLKKSLSRIMESETIQVAKIECGTMITLLNSGLKDKNPEELSKILWQTNQTKP